MARVRLRRALDAGGRPVEERLLDEEYIARDGGGQDSRRPNRRDPHRRRSGSKMPLFTGLRLTRGVDLDAMKSRYGVDVWDRYGEELRAVRGRGTVDL